MSDVVFIVVSATLFVTFIATIWAFERV